MSVPTLEDHNSANSSRRWHLFRSVSITKQCQMALGVFVNNGSLWYCIIDTLWPFSLRQSWYNALNEAESHFRQLLTLSSPSGWKRISATTDSTSRKGKSRLLTVPELADVIVHRHTGKGGDVYRMLLEIVLTEDSVSLESWKAVLTTPELRQEWDPAVEEALLLEMLDHKTRISKTNFMLGWPAKLVGSCRATKISS